MSNSHGSIGVIVAGKDSGTISFLEAALIGQRHCTGVLPVSQRAGRGANQLSWRGGLVGVDLGQGDRAHVGAIKPLAKPRRDRCDGDTADHLIVPA